MGFAPPAHGTQMWVLVAHVRKSSVRVDYALVRATQVPSIETNLFPLGWITSQSGVSWGKPILAPAPEVNIEVSEPNRGFMMNEFQNFELGVRGCCNNFEPQEG